MIEVIPETAKLSDAISAIENGRKSIAVIVDHAGRLLGTISDGDVRRALLSGLGLESPAQSIMRRDPIIMRDGVSAEEIAHLLATRNLEAVPILDAEGCFVRTAFIDDVTNIQGEPGSGANFWAAVIMAGGKGRRMLPQTMSTPKPMLRIGGIPLMERNIRRLMALGVHRFYISINYLGHVIEEHFGQGEALGIEIHYLRETEPLGTGGALRLIEEKPQGLILLMNGDLLTGIDIGKLLAFHKAQGAHLTVAAKEYTVEVPFGVLRVSASNIVDLAEKPTERFLCNAGIYILSPSLFDKLPGRDYFDMTHVIEDGIKAGLKVVAFPIFELWKDVGTPEQLNEARELVELRNISDA